MLTYVWEFVMVGVRGKGVGLRLKFLFFLCCWSVLLFSLFDVTFVVVVVVWSLFLGFSFYVYPILKFLCICFLLCCIFVCVFAFLWNLGHFAWVWNWDPFVITEFLFITRKAIGFKSLRLNFSDITQVDQNGRISSVSEWEERWKSD